MQNCQPGALSKKAWTHQTAAQSVSRTCIQMHFCKSTSKGGHMSVAYVNQVNWGWMTPLTLSFTRPTSMGCAVSIVHSCRASHGSSGRPKYWWQSHWLCPLVSLPWTETLVHATWQERWQPAQCTAVIHLVLVAQNFVICALFNCMHDLRDKNLRRQHVACHAECRVLQSCWAEKQAMLCPFSYQL